MKLSDCGNRQLENEIAFLAKTTLNNSYGEDLSFNLDFLLKLPSHVQLQSLLTQELFERLKQKLIQSSKIFVCVHRDPPTC